MVKLRNLSGNLPRTSAGSGVRAARVSKENAANKPARPRNGTRKAQATPSRKGAKHEHAIAEEPLLIQESGSVWEALGFDAEESANLEARAALMRQIEDIVTDAGWTQAEAARRCGVSQPRINDLLRGKINKFSVDALVNMAGALGRRIDFQLLAA